MEHIISLFTWLIVDKLWLLVDCGFLFAESCLRLWLSVALLARWSRNLKQRWIVDLLCLCRLLVSGSQVPIRMQIRPGQGDDTGATAIDSMLWASHCGMTFFYSLYTEIGLKPTKVSDYFLLLCCLYHAPEQS